LANLPKHPGINYVSTIQIAHTHVPTILSRRLNGHFDLKHGGKDILHGQPLHYLSSIITPNKTLKTINGCMDRRVVQLAIPCRIGLDFSDCGRQYQSCLTGCECKSPKNDSTNGEWLQVNVLQLGKNVKNITNPI
jgi:hypothetical protein